MAYHGESSYLDWLEPVKQRATETVEVHEIRGAAMELQSNPEAYAQASPYGGGELWYEATTQRAGTSVIYAVWEKRDGHVLTIGWSLKPLEALSHLQEQQTVAA